MYIVLFDNILRTPSPAGHGWEGLYFGESGEHRWLDISLAIGRAMAELGLADSAEPTPFSYAELLEFGVGSYVPLPNPTQSGL